MKKILIVTLLALSCPALQAQTFSEWFKQKKTQKKYLIQQIAALQSYIGVARKGYTIAKDGLTTIGSITKGEMDLHGVFFNSLNSVSPAVRRYGKVAAILTLELSVVNTTQESTTALSQSGYFSPKELSYISAVYARVLGDCQEILEELRSLTTDGILSLDDEERIARIDGLFIQMQDNYAFAKDFADQSALLPLQRKKENNALGQLQGLYNLNTTEP